MGNCKYCGKSAGFLKSEHPDCANNYKNGWELMINMVRDVAISGKGIETLEKQLNAIALENFIASDDIRRILAEGYSSAVNTTLDDGILSVEEEKTLDDFKEHFELSQDELGGMSGSQAQLVKAAILRDILDGKIVSRVHVSGKLPFNFHKDETLVWIFSNVDFYEQKTRTRYEGESQGFSLRIAKGIYYRAGAFKGQPIKTTETIQTDNGLLAITNKHIYFSGSHKKFRVPYNKIIEFTPYDDGIGIQKEDTSAKPQAFKTDDGWFTYNLVKNLAQL